MRGRKKAVINQFLHTNSIKPENSGKSTGYIPALKNPAVMSADGHGQNPEAEMSM